MDIDKPAPEFNKFKLDLPAIKQQSEYSFRALFTERPRVIPWSVLAAELAQSESEFAPRIKEILEHASDLITIPEIYPPYNPDNLSKLEKNILISLWKRDYQESLLVDLSKNKSEQANLLSDILGIQTGSIPEGETASTSADFLIILGADRE